MGNANDARVQVTPYLTLTYRFDIHGIARHTANGI